MSRRKRSEESDSLELLLDTVSNVFGGVMFLTLLAALLILTRGAQVMEAPQEETPAVKSEAVSQLVAVEINQVSMALQAQQKMLQRLDPNGSIAKQTDRLADLQDTISLARKQVRRADNSVADRQQELQDLQTEQSDLETQISELQAEIDKQSIAVNRSRSDSERTVRFRPLSRTGSIEAVVLLRYGRWYMLHEGPFGGNLNRDDFFILESNRRITSITPKPHKGHLVTPESLQELMSLLKKRFPSSRFHITVAVWDDSFGDFNAVKDALSAGGYRYRTLTCDSSSRLTNQGAVDPYVQ